MRRPGGRDGAVEVGRIRPTRSHGELGRRKNAKVGHRRWLELRRYFAGELAVDLGARFGNADLLMEGSSFAPAIEGERKAELVDLCGVDEDTVLLLELLPSQTPITVLLLPLRRLF